MVRNHNLLIATVRMNREATCVVAVQLLIGVTRMCSLFDLTCGSVGSGGLVAVSFGLVDLTLCLFWTRCPMIVAASDGQYFVELASGRPGQDE